MKKKLGIAAIAAGILCAALLTGCAGQGADRTAASDVALAPSGTGELVPVDTVTVTANSTVYAVPDRAEITFGIETEATTAKAAQEQNTETADRVVAKLKELGVEESDIKTSGYNIYQRYNNNGRPDGYHVSVQMTVRNQEIEEVGTLITELVAVGVNQMNNISYSCSAYDASYQEALTQAVGGAKEKAEVLAKAAGRTLGEVTVLTEGYQDTSYRYTAGVNASMDFGMSAAKEEAAFDVMPGEAAIRAEVTVTYVLK